MAGVASGGIKIGEGIVLSRSRIHGPWSRNQHAASNVEMFFDRINPFEKDCSKQHCLEELAEILTKLGVPGGIGFKIGSKLATRAIRAKRKGANILILEKVGFPRCRETCLG